MTNMQISPDPVLARLAWFGGQLARANATKTEHIASAISLPELLACNATLWDECL